MKDIKGQAESFRPGALAGDLAAERPGHAEETGRMRSPTAYLVAAFVIAFSVLLIIPMWAFYGVLLPEHGGHAHAGDEETLKLAEFEQMTARFTEEGRLPDGSVRAEHGKPIYVVAEQYTFRPNTIRLKAGEEYEMQMMASDVVHAFSIQMGHTSYNSVVMPRMVTTVNLRPAKPGKYLVVCSEYCGIGHDFMYFSLIVEEGSGEQDGKGATTKKGHKHGH
jgi:heme/copper-type cytochrome/quinol oxidase subunit 2